jgi:hypothetical protein
MIFLTLFEEHGFKKFGHQNIWIKWEEENGSIISRYFATSTFEPTKKNYRTGKYTRIVVKDHSENILLDSNDSDEIENFFKTIRRDDSINKLLD